MRNQMKQILEKVKREMKDGCEEDVEKVNMKSFGGFVWKANKSDDS